MAEKIKKKIVIVDSFPSDGPIKSNVVNKGTGAGGSNTNKNGLPYEELTDLDDKITTLETNRYSSKIKFDDNNEEHFIKTKQSNLFKYMKNNMDKKIAKAHGCKNPDECYINIKSMTAMFWLCM